MFHICKYLRDCVAFFCYWCWPLCLGPFTCFLIWVVSYSIWPISYLTVFSTREVLEGANSITAVVVSFLFHCVQLVLIVSHVSLLVTDCGYFWVLLTHYLDVCPFWLHPASIYSDLLLYLVSFILPLFLLLGFPLVFEEISFVACSCSCPFLSCFSYVLVLCLMFLFVCTCLCSLLLSLSTCSLPFSSLIICL